MGKMGTEEINAKSEEMDRLTRTRRSQQTLRAVVNISPKDLTISAVALIAFLAGITPIVVSRFV